MDNKFVFVAGAPGSMWSMISYRLKRAYTDFDQSDETAERQYSLPEHHKENYIVDNPNWKAKTHIGSYFGPNHEFGHHFDELPKYYEGNVEGFYQECSGPFIDETKPVKLVRCHWFSYWLDWMWENCKGQDLLLIWREPEATRDWWYNMGGWNIHYPVYWWYENDEKMWEKIQEESAKILEFGNRKGVKWTTYDGSDDWIVGLDGFGEFTEPGASARPEIKDIIKVGLIHID